MSRHRPRVRLEPLFSGGGQERGWRSGTLSPPLIVALGEAARIYRTEGAAEAERLGALAQRLYRRLASRLPGVSLNGDAVRRLPGNLNLAFEGVDALALMAALPDLALSTGSACTSAEVEPSYVLTAIGCDRERAGSSLRIGLGPFHHRGGGRSRRRPAGRGGVRVAAGGRAGHIGSVAALVRAG